MEKLYIALYSAIIILYLHSKSIAMYNGGYKIGQVDLLLQLTENQKTNRYWTLIYIRKGVGMCLVEGVLTCLNAGDILFFPPKVSYSFATADLGDEYNENIDAVVLRFDKLWTEALLKVFRSLSSSLLSLREHECPLSVVGPKWMKMSALMDSLANCEPHLEASIILDLISYLSDPSDMIVLSQLSVDISDLSDRLEKIDRYVSCHLYDKVSLDEISTYINMNKTYFCLFFKKHYGMSFTDFLNKKRIDEASLMLMNPVASIAEVATACGFPTVTYFNRIFRKYKGMTPTEYRKSQKVD